MRAVLSVCRRLISQTATVFVALGASDVLAAGDGGGAKLPQLDIATFPTQVFWLVVSFLVLYVLVSRVALPRISEVLEERQDRIADDLDKAETLKKEAEQVRMEYEKALSEARNKAHIVLREAQDAAAKNATEAEAVARETVANMLKDAETRIAVARSDAMSNVRNVARDVAGDAVAKLIGIEVSGEEVDRAVDATMEGRN